MTTQVGDDRLAVRPDPVRLATEGALRGAIHRHGLLAGLLQGVTAGLDAMFWTIGVAALLAGAAIVSL